MDGQYIQAAQFANTILDRCGKEDVEYAVPTSWDSSHLLNLSITDVKTGKLGKSSDFLSRFIERISVFSKELQYGKGNSFLSAVATKNEGPTVTPTAFSQTR